MCAHSWLSGWKGHYTRWMVSLWVRGHCGSDLAGKEDAGRRRDGWIELFCIADPVGGQHYWHIQVAFLSVSTRVLGLILGCIGS